MTFLRIRLPPTIEGRFAELGVAVIEHALTAGDLDVLDQAFPPEPPRSAGALADPFAAGALREWLEMHDTLEGLAFRLGGTAMRLSQARVADQSAPPNWFVPWRQGAPEPGHHRALADLERMIVLRIHLDACEENDGPLEVIPATHTGGRLDSAAIAEVVAGSEPLLCLAARGDIVALRPLVVHRSQRARRPVASRVLHLAYAPADRLMA